MGLSVIQDPNLQKREIVIPLHSTDSEETSEEYTGYGDQRNITGAKQTSIYGILAPLIQINNIAIDFTDVIEFSLKSTSVLPSVSMVVRDRYDLIKTFDTPDNDNSLVVQIIPKFENVYKKINLIFYISSIRISKDFINLTGIYKLPKFLSSNIKSFGEISTFKLFKEISTDTGLGFASNVEDLDQDKRFVYCDNKSYEEILNREINFSGSKDTMEIYEYWVDFWDYLNLAEVYKLYKTILPDEHPDMQIWVSCKTDEVLENQEIPIRQTVANISNALPYSNTELYTKTYNIVNRAGSQVYLGSDKVYSIYGMDDGEYLDTLMLDSHVKQDIFTKYEYLGENYGTFNYLLASKKRAGFLQKVNTETIEVVMTTPLLALQRGAKVNFLWYINDSEYDYRKEVLETQGVIDKNSTINIPYTDDDTENPEKGKGEIAPKYQIDKNISGQYLIIGCHIKFSNQKWEYILTLCKYASDKVEMLDPYLGQNATEREYENKIEF